MAPHSSTLAWKIPWMEKPGRLQSMGSLRVGYDWATSLSLFTFMHWRRKWQPTPVFLPGESQGQRSLVGCCLWGHTESDMTKVTQQQQQNNDDHPSWALRVEICVPYWTPTYGSSQFLLVACSSDSGHLSSQSLLLPTWHLIFFHRLVSS